MTNAERIRRMTVDELQVLLSAFECGDITYAVTFCDLCESGGNTKLAAQAFTYVGIVPIY